MNWADPEWHEFIVELATYDYGANPAAVIALANYRTAQQMALDLNQPSEVVRAWDQLRRRAIADLRTAFNAAPPRRPEIDSMFPYVETIRPAIDAVPLWLAEPQRVVWPASLSSPSPSPS